MTSFSHCRPWTNVDQGDATSTAGLLEQHERILHAWQLAILRFAVTLDDTLRQIPAFSLFRRTSSLVAHPTTQGVSLRGIGPSGVSRTLPNTTRWLAVTAGIGEQYALTC